MFESKMRNEMPGKNKGIFKYFSLVAVVALLWAATSALSAQNKFYYGWTAPPEFAVKKNPVPDTKAARAKGAAVFKEWCLRCHGSKGDGEGTSSLSLNVPPGDFTDKKRMKKQTDGALFWKVRVGRGEMPPWQLRLKEEEIWLAVRYIRGFSK